MSVWFSGIMYLLHKKVGFVERIFGLCVKTLILYICHTSDHYRSRVLMGIELILNSFSGFHSPKTCFSPTTATV